jgi:hypothetical protein
VNQIFLDNKIPVYLDSWIEPNRFTESFNGFPFDKLVSYVDNNLQFMRITKDNITEFHLPLSITDTTFSLFKKFNKSKTFFYPIGIHWWYSENIDTEKNIFQECLEINQEVISFISSGQCKIILYNPFEGWEESFWQKVIDCIIKKYNTINREQFIVISNNVDIKNIKSVPLLDNQQFEQSSGQFDNIESLHKHIRQCIINKVNRPYKFVALMRRPRPTRWALMTELHKDRNKGLMSFSIDVDIGNISSQSTEILDIAYAIKIQKNLFKLGSLENKSLLDFKNAYPKTYKKFMKNGVYNYTPFWISNDVNPKTNPKTDNSIFKFTDSYLHIVSETYFRNVNENHLHFSEKTFKPIWYLQPFILFSKSNSLKKLTEFGYKTFSKWIDEDYDKIENDTKRFNAAINSAKNFYLQPTEKLNNDLLEMLPILQHNFENLKYNQINQTSQLLEKLSTFI